MLSSFFHGQPGSDKATSLSAVTALSEGCPIGIQFCQTDFPTTVANDINERGGIAMKKGEEIQYFPLKTAPKFAFSAPSKA